MECSSHESVDVARLGFSWRHLLTCFGEAGSRRSFHDYFTYGISLRSDIPLNLPEHSAQGLADVTLFLATEGKFAGAIEGLSDDGDGDGWATHIRCADGSDYLCWPELFEFLISPDGRLMACVPLAQVSPESFQNYLLAQVLSFALVKQGREPLHATVVVVDGHAVALLGNSGYGKSTLAAAFMGAGHAILTDDLLLIRDVGGILCGFPGPARIKLFPEAAQQLLPHGTTGTPMNPGTKKLIIPLGPDQVHAWPAPLIALYVLDEPGVSSPEQARIDRISRKESLVELLRSTFNTRVRDSDRLRRQFLAAKEWATRLRVRRVTYPRTLPALEHVRDAIVSDVRESFGSLQ